VPALIGRSWGSHVRVFGTVATGAERAGSDIDILFGMGTPLSLMEFGELERQISELPGAPVDLIPASALCQDVRDRVIAQAVSL
jgi:predicted nucleotidyltransferase